MEHARKILAASVKTKKKERNLKHAERQVVALELPLRRRVAHIGSITARNEKLDALKATALRAEIQRVTQMLEDTGPQQQVLQVAAELKRDLRNAAAGR